MIKNIVIGVLILGIVSAIAYYFIKNKKRKSTSIVDNRLKPLSTWTNADWLKNGYTQAEINAANTTQNILTGFNPFF